MPQFEMKNSQIIFIGRPEQKLEAKIISRKGKGAWSALTLSIQKNILMLKHY